MQNFPMMPIFDVIITLLGAYILYTAVKMKSEMKMPPLFVTPEEMRTCKNEKGFVNYLYGRVVAFGLIDLLFGLEGLFSDLVYDLGTAVNAVLVVVFVAAWIWFSVQLRKGREEFL